MAKKGEWVEIENIVLKPGERAPQVPEDTQKTPLIMHVKGFLLDNEAQIGDTVTIQTYTGRIVLGKLIAVNPRYVHDFAYAQPELLTIGLELKQYLGGE